MFTALGVTQNPGGLFDIVDFNNHPGNVFFVRAGTALGQWGAGSDAAGYGLTPAAPCASVDYAIGLCTASAGDVIYVGPGHAETTTAIAADVAGIKIIGLGWGRLKPAITATTAATDLLVVSAANVEIRNIRFVGAASGVLSLLDIEGVDFVGSKLVFEHGAAPTTAVLVGTGAHRFELEDCLWRGTAAGPAIGISFEGKVNDWVVRRARGDYGGSSGLDTAFISSSFKMKGYQIVDLILVGFDTAVIDINSSSAAIGDGVLIGGGSVASAGITIANAHDVGGCAIIDHKVTDVVTARGLVVPVATPT